ncbi:hypothetical protein ColKHC_08026 [Colletotrichum higginsianum]|nr:hypothetical protein ColKHC_08026 [Colletotrichum higginsianum]
MSSWFIIAFLGIALHLMPVEAQYNQDWTWHAGTSGNPVPKWRPENTGPWLDVVGFGGKAVWLEYNCYWMPAICQNARNYLNSPAGQNRNWPTAFTYDLVPIRGNEHRREAVCPQKKTPWKDSHSCPESDQPTVMRSKYPAYLGKWHHTELESPASIPVDLTIKAWQPPTGGNREPSGLKYSCDEFPAAKWIEGGDGLNHQSQSTKTRCAAIGDGKGCGIHGEQNWQGQIHGGLRWTLKNTFNIPNSQHDKKVAMFFFRMSNGGYPDPAARVIINDAGTETVDREVIPKVARSTNVTKVDASTLDIVQFLNWANKVTVEELLSTHSVQVRDLTPSNRTQSADWE